VCPERYVVEWELRLLPSDELRGRRSSEVRAREEHFYRVTDAKVREMAARYMGPDVDSDSERIRLVGAERDEGRIRGTGCGEGPRVTADYLFVFDARWEAEYFRDWLRRDDSEHMVDSLRHVDRLGVCGGTGDTRRVEKKPVCL
jgi:hypothetical protein